MDKDIRTLNDALIENAGQIGPSLLYLSLYGPIRGYLKTDTVELLNYRLNQIEDSYKNFILPKSKNIFKLFDDPFYSSNLRNKINLEDELKLELNKSLEDKDSFKINSLENQLSQLNSNIFPQSKKELESRLEISDFEDIRKIFQDNYNSQFFIPNNVKIELYDSNYLDKNKKVNFILNSNTIYSFRFKNLTRSFEKYVTKYLELSNEDKENYLNLVIDIASDPFDFWTVYDSYLEKGYSSNILEATMAGDVFGMKEIMLCEEIALNRINYLKRNKTKLDFEGFEVVTQRFDDHSHRTETSYKPGGIHVTLVDKALKNFPLEVQFLDLKSAIFDMFGSHSHSKYSQKRNIFEKIRTKKIKETDFNKMCLKFNLNKNLVENFLLKKTDSFIN